MIGDEGHETRHKEDSGGSDLRPFAERYEEAALRSSMYRLEKWRAGWMKTERLARNHPERPMKKHRWHKNDESMNDDWEPRRSIGR